MAYVSMVDMLEVVIKLCPYRVTTFHFKIDG